MVSVYMYIFPLIKGWGEYRWSLYIYISPYKGMEGEYRWSLYIYISPYKGMGWGEYRWSLWTGWVCWNVSSDLAAYQTLTHGLPKNAIYLFRFTPNICKYGKYYILYSIYMYYIACFFKTKDINSEKFLKTFFSKNEFDFLIIFSGNQNKSVWNPL